MAETKKQTKRRSEKRAQKALKKAEYERYRDLGITKGSKRAQKKARLHKLISTKPSHPYGSCGNVGCSRCFPRKDTCQP